MEPLDQGKRSYTTFVELGGRSVPLGEIRDRLAELPLDMVLGVLARISAHQLRDGNEFFNASNQGRYLALAIVDDFPAALPRAAEMYVPNRIPITGERHNFIHEHGLAALAQLAVLHCRTDTSRPTLATPDFGHVARLLLILNDHLSRPNPLSSVPTLKERRRLAVDALYTFQFNHLGNVRSAMLALGRLHQLLTVHLPRHLPEAEQVVRAEIGVSIDNYLLLAGVMIAHVWESAPLLSSTEGPWTNVDALVSSLGDHAGEARRVMDLFRQSPDDFRHRTRDEGNDLFDFAELQRRPLIEVHPNQMVWPVFSLFVRQLLSFPLQVIDQAEPGNRAIGRAYESYARSLVERIAKGENSGEWVPLQAMKVKPRERGTSVAAGEIDSVLWRKNVAVVMEHKAGNLVLSLGDRKTLRNALGPTDGELDLLPAIPKKDSGALTHGLWQLARTAVGTDESLRNRFGASPMRVLPLITTLEDFEIDDWIRLGYLDPLLAGAKITLPATWSKIEWVTVVGLEALAQLADEGRLDLVNLLEGKAEFPGRFLVYLATRFGTIPADSRLAAVVMDLMDAASLRFFGKPARLTAELGRTE
jgi:hypothetical protein